MDSNLTRRGLIGLTASATLAACSTHNLIEGQNADINQSGTFQHGVASGDPFSTSVVLWTRISTDIKGDVDVTWEASLNPEFSNISASGIIKTNASRDHCVKALANDLTPGTNYYYRFHIGEVTSPTGRTRTLPSGPTEQLNFAVVSCANWQHGYFNTYDAIAKRAKETPYDALIHLGDYFYEYGALETPRLDDRIHEPSHEVINLDDYRIRHAQYRSDPALQATSAAMPIIAVWDDHETSNDSWKTGAQNHQTDLEGTWDKRRQAALRAYYEWMPIREPKPGRVRSDIYRNFRFGDLANLTCVETRLTARAKPIVVETYLDDIKAEGGADTFRKDVLYAPDREMFGAEQQDFIIKSLRDSKTDGVPWRLLANQVIMSRLLTPDFTPYVTEDTVEKIESVWPDFRNFLELSKYGMPVYPDSWDGYPVARENFYAALDAADLNDMLVLTGDAHEFWVNELTSDTGTKVGVELVTSSVSSETLKQYLGEGTKDHNLLLTKENADARYYNASVNGFIELILTHKKATARMIGIDTVLSRDYNAKEISRFTLRKSGETIKVKSPRGLSLTQRALFHGLG